MYDIKNPIWNKFFKPAISYLKFLRRLPFFWNSTYVFLFSWNFFRQIWLLYLKKKYVNDISFYLREKRSWSGSSTLKRSSKSPAPGSEQALPSPAPSKGTPSRLPTYAPPAPSKNVPDALTRRLAIRAPKTFNHILFFTLEKRQNQQYI